ncbi:MAG: hypothetical protein ACRC6K_04380, partial [Fusobacteriaceae bacterium]
IYLFFLIYFFYSYFNTGFILEYDIKTFFDKYFGISKYIVFIILLGNYFIEHIKKEKRNTILTIMFLIYIFYLAFATLLLSYKLNLIIQNPIPNLEYHFVKYSVFDYDLGLIASFLISNLILINNTYLFYLVFLISILICLFMGIIVTNRVLIKGLKYIKIEYNKLKILEKKEEKVKEKIAIKESIEKNEIKQLEKIKEYREQMIQNEITSHKERTSKLETEFHIFELKNLYSKTKKKIIRIKKKNIVHRSIK